MFDLILRNATVVSPANHIESIQDIGIKDGIICAVSPHMEETAAEDIDLSGKILTPGFIDAHAHEDAMNPDGTITPDITARMLRMGVTTMVGGNCGGSPSDYSRYIKAFNKGMPCDLALMAGHGTIRKLCGQPDIYAPTDSKTVKKMVAMADQMLSDGFCGISFGVRYVPGTTEEELISLCEVAKSHEKPVSSHVRDDAEKAKEAFGEFIECGRRTGASLEISHIGSMAAFGMMGDILAQIDSAAAEGIDVFCDCYPYDAFSTGIGETTYDGDFLSRYHCDITKIEITDGEYKGIIPNMDVFYEIRRTHPEFLTVAHVMKAEEVQQALFHPRVMLGSDGILVNGAGHPRAAGSFPRFIKKAIKEKGMPISDGIAKITSMAANRYGFADRGVIAVGKKADITVFDLNEISDCATFENPELPPKGIDLVVKNGKVVLKNGVILLPAEGRFLSMNE